MAHDIILGRTSRDWSIDSIEPSSQGSIPSRRISTEQAEEMVQKNMKVDSLFGMKLNREQAENKTIAFMKAQKIGIKSSTGSLLIPNKQQAAFFRKIDDIRYDVRRAGVKAIIGLLALSASLVLIGVAGIYKASKEGPR